MELYIIVILAICANTQIQGVFEWINCGAYFHRSTRLYVISQEYRNIKAHLRVSFSQRYTSPPVVLVSRDMVLLRGYLPCENALSMWHKLCACTMCWPDVNVFRTTHCAQLEHNLRSMYWLMSMHWPEVNACTPLTSHSNITILTEWAIICTIISIKFKIQSFLHTDFIVITPTVRGLIDVLKCSPIWEFTIFFFKLCVYTTFHRNYVDK